MKIFMKTRDIESVEEKPSRGFFYEKFFSYKCRTKKVKFCSIQIPYLISLDFKPWDAILCFFMLRGNGYNHLYLEGGT